MQGHSNQPEDKLAQNAVRIEPWGKDDLALLKKLLGDPEMTRYLGGPESDEQLAERQARYERLAEGSSDRVFKIVDQHTGEGIGSIVYWESVHNDEQIYEIGWSVLPAFQGRGIAAAATSQAIAMARMDGKHRFLHAFPSVANPPSNALCRKLGFIFVEECTFEYPKGNFMQCNDWCLDLSTEAR